MSTQIPITIITDQTKASWESLQSFPSRQFSNPVLFGLNTIIIAPWFIRYWSESQGIFSYNHSKNKWNVFIKYQKETNTSNHNLSINNFTNELYLYGKESKLIKISITSNDNSSFNYSKQQKSFGSFPTSILMNNEYHIIGGQYNKQHLIWNESKQEFIANYEFPDLKHDLDQPSIVYLPKKQQLLVLGGFDGLNPIDKTWKYDLKSKKWGNMELRIWRKDSCIVTDDERYVILFGGSQHNKVYSLDLQQI